MDNNSTIVKHEMNVIHLYDPGLRDQGILKSFCGIPNVKPGFDVIPVRNPQYSKVFLNICESCMNSDDYILWHLAGYK